ncbi:MAG: glycerol-3-phosphate dehydrogenase, partial [Gammaproteobacteria bacterium]|nr:glycerol-3-phosphate dehydrogenase [Gammaproteobacteria bacterium]
MKDEYDIAIIGGGINGAGIARDAALRGLKVILLEKDDFGSGTTSWSSRLIHGGLRYLEYGEIPLVFESLHERRRLRKLASHLVRELKLSIPIYKDSRRSKFIIRLGMLAYDLLSIGKSLPTHRMLTARELLMEEPGLREEGLTGGAQYFDAQVTFAERLVLENVIAAREAGAEVRNYCSVIGINVRDREVRSIQFVDQISGRETEISARVVVNAAGPWVDRVLATVNREIEPVMGGTKGSHIIVGRFAGAPSSAFYVEARKDGRPFFVIPWNDQVLIGTTDIRYEGDPGEVTASDEEIDYLVAETNAVFPSANLSRKDIHYAYAGVRPLPRHDKGPESAITRKHIILNHRRQAKGLISIIGGKLTTYRNLAEIVVNKVVREIGRDFADCQTRDQPLPGSIDLESTTKIIVAYPGIQTRCVARLQSVYGSRAERVVKLSAEHPGFVDEAQT